MQPELSTPGSEANFSFSSLIIGFQKHEATHVTAFQHAIAWEPGQEIDAREADYRALLKHEVTHFLDMTTTRWGWQYTIRKLQLLRNLIDEGPELGEARSVFALETGELAVHTSLVVAGKEPPAACDRIQHHLRYTRKFGVCIMVEYLKGAQVCHQVPVSMLSLLEANATASEFLSLIQCADSHGEYVARLLSMRDVKDRFESVLNDPNRFEYSCLLHLTRIHFSHLSLEAQMKLVAAVARFSLDAESLQLAIVANIIQRTFRNDHLGASICMELRRDHCRQLVFFKTILLMYQWRNEWAAEGPGEIDNLIVQNPTEAVHRLWSFLHGEPIPRIEDDEDWVVNMRIDWLREFGTELSDSEIIHESCNVNRRALATTSAGVLSFRSMKLLNPVLADGTELLLPNSFDIRTYDYFDKRSDLFSRLDVEHKTMRHVRFHLSPNDPMVVQLRNFSN
ncbi:hypothetical protein LMG26686_03022 [Achromobacter mucicolens]|uniref:hypothetical protein n=1 Tax=Achromobacter mucicolens TaxID=1389922 RepID=UPI0014685B0F|nr:hypothetical protein [Achromobacter mucicolens]CAB3872140.1 hypothetical protein LMG26686_03022 [Achromobacter mucicolens]